MTVITGLDPGLSSGYSHWFYDAMTPPQHLSHGTITGGLDGLMDWVDAGNLDDTDELISESFILDGRTMYPEVEPLRIEGYLAGECRRRDVPLTFQRNSYKGHVTDAKLKELGIWWPGKGHDRDSARHVWANLKVRLHYPTLMLAFPPRVEGSASVSPLVGGF